MLGVLQQNSIFQTQWDSYVPFRVCDIMCKMCAISSQTKNLSMEMTKEHEVPPLVGELLTNYNLSILEEWRLVFLKGVTPEKLTTLQGFVPHLRVFKQHKLYLMVLK